jgi:predicted Rossmann-fold nucleotide-binding protein
MFEALTLKRLGLYFNPIVVVNTNDYYAPLQAFMQRMIDERFMNPQHLEMWKLVATPDEVLPAIRSMPKWREDARNYAVVR